MSTELKHDASGGGLSHVNHAGRTSCLHILPAVVGLVAILAGHAAAASDLPPPVSGRFEVYRLTDGFVLRGYRSEVGDGNRFLLWAGMPADLARQQMGSVRWDEATGLDDPSSRRMAGVRLRYGNIVEAVDVVLDPGETFVETVAYAREPAEFSRPGLLRYLYAAYRRGRPVIDEPDRLLIAYGPRDGQLLRVEAIRLPTRQPRWRLVHRMDAGRPTIVRANETPEQRGWR